MNALGKLIIVTVFAVAMAWLEASVVVYLRALYYPDGFAYPLRIIPDSILAVELLRELASIVMIAAVAAVAGQTAWERFAYFALQFGIWDIFYYVWLKVTLDWPSSLLDWDILFLIPVAWSGPVLAPLLISIILIVAAVTITRCIRLGRDFRPGWLSWALSILATIAVLASFLSNASAIMKGDLPGPFWYYALVPGLLMYGVAIALAWRRSISGRAVTKRENP